MKKFTKVCLITVTVLLILGCAFCLIFGLVGGFRQIDESGTRIYDIGLGSLKFGYDGSQFGIGYWDDDWDDDWDAEFDSIEAELDGIDAELAEPLKLPYTAEEIRQLDLEIGASGLVIGESQDDHVWITNKSTNQDIRYGMEGDTLCFSAGTKYHYFFNAPIKQKSKGKIYLYLPKNMDLNRIDMELGTSNLDCMELSAKDIDIEIGAAKANLKGLSGDNVTLEVGAGKADIEMIEAKQTNLSIGAGKMDLVDLMTEELTVEVGAGKIEARGSVTEEANLEVAMGNLDLFLTGKEEDYDYMIDCAMGTVTLGKQCFSNLANENTIDNGSSRDFNIECAMGEINVSFKQDN